MSTQPKDGCGCPPTAPPAPTVNGVHHVFLTVNDLARSRAFYAALMPRLGYPAMWEYEGGESIGFLGSGGSFWIKRAAPEYANDVFAKDRVGLCEVAFRAESRAHVDAIARDLPAWGATILDQPREYPHYVPGYYAVFFADPNGIKLEVVFIPS
jgi:catechol 2,3-dioxygenase-like lactoylglutathione lyase family enzyme